MKNIALLIGTVLLLSGCVPTKIDMDLEHAKIAGGFYNTSKDNLGDVYVWDINASSLQKIKTIIPNTPDDNSTRVRRGKKWDNDSATVSKNTNISVKSDTSNISEELIKIIEGEARTEFAKATKVYINDYQNVYFTDAPYTLNAATERHWREYLASAKLPNGKNKYLDNSNFKFVLINEVIMGKKASISFDNNYTGSAKANILKVGKHEFEITYGTHLNAELEAKEQAPLIVKAIVFDFMTDQTQTDYPGLRFYPSHGKESIFDYQKF